MGTNQQESEKSLDVEELERLVDAEEKWAGKVYAAAKYIIGLNWPVIPIAYGSKQIPGREAIRKRGLKKQLTYEDASTSPEKIKHWFDPEEGIWRGMNLGLACGTVVSVADLDVKDGKNGFDTYEAHFGFNHGRTPTQTTPSGGVHLVFQHRDGFRTRTGVLDGVDTRGCKRDGGIGSHIVIYPSVVDVHSTGKIEKAQYRWESGGIPAEPPQKLIETVGKLVEFRPKDGNRPGRGNENVEENDYFPDATLEDIQDALIHCDPSVHRDEWLWIGMAIHSEWDGTDGFDIWHEWSKDGKNYGRKDERTGEYDPNYGEQDCWNVWQSFTNDGRGITLSTLFGIARANGYRKPGEFSPELVEGLRYNDKGGLQNTNHNLWIMLQSPEFRDEFGGFLKFDKFQDEIIAGNQEFINEGYVRIARWIATKFHFERGADTVRSYARMVAKDNPVDTLEEYINDLVWDGTTRLDTLGEEILCAKNDYQLAAVKRWLVGGIARALQPGCSSTHMLILFGDQGIGKSRFFKALSPSVEWFSDSPTFKFQRDTAHRDEEIKLQGKWVVEVPELAGIWKSDFNDLKNFLTLRAPVVRKPYDTDAIELPRRCLFGGTTNMDSIINDPTGGRRFAFLSLGAEKVDVDWVKENRDQIWAEAKHLYDEGETWWFNDDEFAMQVEENKSFQREHPWASPIYEWAADKSRFTTSDIFEFVLEVPKGQQDQRKMADIKGILEPEGWKRTTIKVKDGPKFNGWKNPNAEVDNEFIGLRWESSPRAEPDDY